MRKKNIDIILNLFLFFICNFSILYCNVRHIHTDCSCIWVFAYSPIFFVIKNPPSEIWSCRFSNIASKTWPNGCDVIWSIRQWRNWTRIWKQDIDLRYKRLWRRNRTWIWGLDVDWRNNSCRPYFVIHIWVGIIFMNI